MRLFIAIALSPEIREQYTSLLKIFSSLEPQLKWIRPENLHVTLKFLGETTPEKLASLENVLASVQSTQPVIIEFRGLGFFPNPRRPRVFWASLEASPNLQALAADIDRLAHSLGFPLEERPFAPHLTLARINSPQLSPQFQQTLLEKQTLSFGSLRATHFHLIESKLKPKGAEYTTLQSFRFAQEA